MPGADGAAGDGDDEGTGVSAVWRRAVGSPRPRVVWTVGLLFLLTVFACVAVPDTAGAAGRDNRDAHARQAAYFAAQLRRSPVYVSDQMPRTVPRSAHGRFLKQANRAGVPIYVLVLPRALDRYDLLPDVHEKLGWKGVYVVVRGDNPADLDARSYGVHASSMDAWAAMADGQPEDAAALDTLTRFVDALRDGDANDEHNHQVTNTGGSLYTSPEARSDQSVLAGVLTGAVPLLIVLTAGTVCFRRRRVGRYGTRLWVPTLCAAALVPLIPFVASQVFDATHASGHPDPLASDMRLRVDRVADGLRERSVYSDVESVSPFSPAQRRALAARLGALYEPVYVVALPFDEEDETEGMAKSFAQRLHNELGRDGVYVLVDTAWTSDTPEIELVNYGAKLDGERLQDLDEEVRHGAEPEEAHPTVYQRLVKLTRHIAHTPKGRPERPLATYETHDPATDRLTPVLSGPFRGAVLGGALGATGLWGVGLGVVLWGAGVGGVDVPGQRGSRSSTNTRAATRRPAGTRWAAGSFAVPRAAVAVSAVEKTDETSGRYYGAPARPRAHWLRTAVHHELGALSEDFEAHENSGEFEKGRREQVHHRIWDCMDAATLLLDRVGDQRVDADIAPCDLATALVLVRAGQAALDAAKQPHALSHTSRLCALNPLHGPAETVVGVSSGKTLEHSPAANCLDCQRKPHKRRRLLRLPTRAPGTGWTGGLHKLLRRVVYTDLSGPLGSAAEGGSVDVRRLVRYVREWLGVHD